MLREAFVEQYALSGVDMRPASGLESLVADMTDLEAIKPAFEGIDTVIDLAAVPSQFSPWSVVYESNIPSTYNTLEASRAAGVKRVIFASSNHATGMYENAHPPGNMAILVNAPSEGLTDVP